MLIFLIIFGYLVGAIPFAFILTRQFAGIDIRFEGSGNVGTANVFRTTRIWLGVTVMALDIAKGATVVLAAKYMELGDVGCAFVGVTAVVGHLYPVWLNFHGGKGVATACGVFGILSPVATAGAVVLFVTVVWIFRYVSLGSIISSFVLVPLVYVTGEALPDLVSASVVAILIIYHHRSNIIRLCMKEEVRLERRG